MSGQEPLERITLDPGVMAGEPVIKGTRLSVEVDTKFSPCVKRRAGHFVVVTEKRVRFARM